MKKLVTLLLISLGLFSAFFFGVYWNSNKLAKSMYKSQAELNYAVWDTYKKLEQDFENGCDERGKDRIKQVLSEKEMLIAEYYQRSTNKEFLVYVRSRDSQLASKLSSYNIDWSREWKLQPCD